MRIVEKVLATAIIAGIVLTFLLIPGGDEIAMLVIVLALLILACIYFPLGFLFFNQIRLRNVFKKKAYEQVTAGKIVIAVLVGIALSIFCVGTLVKILHLPGDDEMLLLSVMGTIGLAITVGLMKLFKSEINAKFIFIRLGIIGVLGIVLVFTSELSMVRLLYRNHPAYIEAYAKYRDAEYKYRDDTSPEEYEYLRNKMELEYHRIWMNEKEFKEYEEKVSN